MNSYFKFTLSLSLVVAFNGCSSKMDNITKKIVKVETPHGKYTTVNTSSGAYGRYQIMPKTAKHYTKKLDMNHRTWKHPKNQDKIYQAILSDNVKSLERCGIDVNAFTVYGSHQQGAYGFQCIMANQNMTSKSYMRLRANLPRKYKYASNSELRGLWINYWKNKMES